MSYCEMCAEIEELYLTGTCEECEVQNDKYDEIEADEVRND